MAMRLKNRIPVNCLTMDDIFMIFLGRLVVPRSLAFFGWEISCWIKSLILYMRVTFFLIQCVLGKAKLIIYKLRYWLGPFTVKFISLSLNRTVFNGLLFTARLFANNSIIQFNSPQIKSFLSHCIGLHAFKRIIYVFHQWTLTLFHLYLGFLVCERTFWSLFDIDAWVFYVV